MIFLWDKRVEAVRELIAKYPSLMVVEENSKLIRIEGRILINRKTSSFCLCKEYVIRIIAYRDDSKLPEAYDIANQIDCKYCHRYDNGMLCLDTDTAIRIRYENGLDLCSWMSDFVEVYFFSYEYYKRNGEFPFGERSHGKNGIIETYGELFHMTNKQTILNCLKYLSTQGYNGHDECPCGSKKYIRKCHKNELLLFFNDKRKLEIVKKDYQNILRESILEACKRI